MRPVDQTRFGSKVVAEYGDCLAACVASVFEVPLAEVPHFAQVHGPNPLDGPVWWLAMGEWAAERGYALTYHEGCVPRDFAGDPSDPVERFALGVGQSPRGDWLHTVVIDLDGNVAHDPHPSRSGIDGPLLGFDYFSRVPS
jgi:hypothetical protein